MSLQSYENGVKYKQAEGSKQKKLYIPSYDTTCGAMVI